MKNKTQRTFKCLNCFFVNLIPTRYRVTSMLSLEKCKRVESLKLQMGNFAQKTNKQNKAKNLEQKFNWKTRENELFGFSGNAHV